METRFKVTGMKCDGCIAKARQALAEVPGVTEAEFDLKSGTAVVKGDVHPQAVVETLTKVGYPAQVESG